MNGALILLQTTDKDKNAVLDMVMDKPLDAESSIWYNSLEQSPFIEMYITPTKAKVAVEKAMRQKGVRGNPDVTPILQDDWKLLKSYVSNILLLVFLVRIRASSSLPKRGDVCRGES